MPPGRCRRLAIYDGILRVLTYAWADANFDGYWTAPGAQ